MIDSVRLNRIRMPKQRIPERFGACELGEAHEHFVWAVRWWGGREQTFDDMELYQASVGDELIYWALMLLSASITALALWKLVDILV